MREFFFHDKSKGVSFRGIIPFNDVDCPPFDYYRFSHAELVYMTFLEKVKTQCPIDIPEKVIRGYVMSQVDENIKNMLLSTSLKPEIHRLLSDDDLSSKDQEKLLKGIVLTPADILWLNKDSQDLGYRLNIYHEETFPVKFDAKQKPVLLNQKDDNIIETVGKTDMTEGEMRALLEQRKVIQARVYHRGGHWHCFYFTYKGLAGQEKGTMGTHPHYHYISDKSGIAWHELMNRIKECNMPSSRVHIIINR